MADISAARKINITEIQLFANNISMSWKLVIFSWKLEPQYRLYGSLSLLSTFLTVNAHLGAGVHQQAIQRDLWKGQRNYLTMHDLCVWYKYSHSSRCIHIGISFLTELQHKNIFSITKKPLQSHEIIIVSALKKMRDKWMCFFVMMMISLLAQGNYVTMPMCFPWVTKRNNEGGGRWCLFAIASHWRRGRIEGWRKEVKQMHTLLSSGCTLHIYKEEGACLPRPQKE